MTKLNREINGIYDIFQESNDINGGIKIKWNNYMRNEERSYKRIIRHQKI